MVSLSERQLNNRESFQKLIPSIKSFKEIGINKNLAKFGDIITNLVFSQAKSIVTGIIDAKTVNQTILSEALKGADMRVYARKQADAHAIADSAEAFIGYIYIAHIFTIDDMVDILVPKLQIFQLNDRMMEEQAGIEAFTTLLLKIKEVLIPKLSL